MWVGGGVSVARGLRHCLEPGCRRDVMKREGESKSKGEEGGEILVNVSANFWRIIIFFGAEEARLRKRGEDFSLDDLGALENPATKKKRDNGATLYGGLPPLPPSDQS